MTDNPTADLYQAWKEVSDQIHEQAEIIDNAEQRIDQLGKLMREAMYQLALTVPCNICKANPGEGCDFSKQPLNLRPAPSAPRANHIGREQTARTLGTKP